MAYSPGGEHILLVYDAKLHLTSEGPPANFVSLRPTKAILSEL